MRGCGFLSYWECRVHMVVENLGSPVPVRLHQFGCGGPLRIESGVINPMLPPYLFAYLALLEDKIAAWTLPMFANSGCLRYSRFVFG